MSVELAFVLRSQRVMAGLSQNALARQAGVAPAYVNRIEAAYPINPSRAVVESFAAAMRLDVYESARLFVTAGHWPWSLSVEDTRLLLDIGSKIAVAATVRQEATS